MSLLPMPNQGGGLLGGVSNALFGNPQSQAITSIAAALLGSRGNFRQALGEAGLAGMQAYNSGMAQQAADRFRQMQMEQMGLQNQQAKEAMERQRQIQEAARASMIPPQQLPGNEMESQNQAFTGDTGMTQGRFDMRSFVDRVMRIDPMQGLELQKQMRGPGPVSVAQGAALVDPTTGRTIFQNPKEQNLNDLIVMGPDGKPQINRLALEAKRELAKAGSTNINIGAGTKGQIKADEKFASDFVDFATGGYSDIQKQLAQLRQAKSVIDSGTRVSGPLVGMLPESVVATINPQAVAVREQIQEVAQRNLKAVLGAQFTEKEGEALIKRVFNPMLSNEENSRRLGRLITQIEEAAKAKADAAEYFSQNGTLTGWQGRMPTLSDFDVSKSTPPAASGGWSIKPAGR